MHITEINVYPVKSLRGHSVEEATICRYGLQSDRQWMLVDDNSRMITQRECPRLALFIPQLADGRLTIHIPDSPTIEVPLDAHGWSENHVNVNLWGQEYVGVAAADSINAAISNALGRNSRLLSIRSDLFRTNQEVAFHDDAPILVISRTSLDELNRRMPTPLPMNRFRPTLVVAGSNAFAEDTWQRISIDGTQFRAVKQCVRCAITTVDQAEGVFRGPEPLKTLATFRRKAENVAFGAYFRPESTGGKLHVGDQISVLEQHAYATSQ